MNYQKKFLLLIIFSILSLGWMAIAPKQSLTESAATRPAPPRRIPPNKVKPGGGLDASQQACSNNNKSLVALIPVSSPVLTAQAHPSFLFYVPDSAGAISRGEFSILSAREDERIYQTTINFDRTPGIIKIDLPPSPEYALEKGSLYHWYLKIYCQNSPTSQNLIDVNGWVQRTPNAPQDREIADNKPPHIWQDAIANAAEDAIAKPQDSTARDRWLQLLQHINLEELADVNIYEETNNN